MVKEASDYFFKQPSGAAQSSFWEEKLYSLSGLIHTLAARGKKPDYCDL